MLALRPPAASFVDCLVITDRGSGSVSGSVYSTTVEAKLADRTPRLNEDALGRGSPSECNLNRRIASTGSPLRITGL